MMRTMYRILPDVNDYRAENLADAIAVVENAKNLIMRLCSNYSVALEIIDACGVEHRLDEVVICDQGMEVMCGLNDLKTFLSGELEDMDEPIDVELESEEEE